MIYDLRFSIAFVHLAIWPNACHRRALRGRVALLRDRNLAWHHRQHPRALPGRAVVPNRRDDDGVVATASDGVRDAIHCVRVRIRSRRSATLPGHARRLGRPPSRKSKQCLNGQMQS